MAAERELHQSDLAALILEEAAEPLHYEEITRRVIGKGWLDGGRGATPQRSLYRAITEEVRHDPEGARFAYERGVVSLRRWDVEAPIARVSQTPAAGPPAEVTPAPPVPPAGAGSLADAPTIAEVTRLSLLGFLPQMPPSQLTAIIDRGLRELGVPGTSRVLEIGADEMSVEVSLPLEWVVDSILVASDEGQSGPA
jgi:hypothetical protein